ncbi:DUF445 domain-containing protein [Paenibacillus sp. P96]|uniref:DUF445 domain-containing protein n=1 Tax=Paenibacillus zeirhizosphaerae TaxID=2987519 RepID=A0ABT9FMU7_9BACL|nr:DUF445 domain-containing protein [Paenibacillus sp. P96]MDP4096047.1 DUF445 domain-containing protein [Paenibacillus sp. P96]
MAKPKQRRQTKKAATWSLIIMGAGFAASLPFQQYGAVRLLAGAFEAGMVGGLADWFAVTALFRHPLGIPIPHTALLPKNRGKLTDALVSTVENNLLNKESIAAKIKDVRLAEMLLDGAEQALASPRAAEAIDLLAKRLISRLPLDSLAPVITEEIRRQIMTQDAGQLLESLAKQTLERGYDQKVLDYALEQAEAWLHKSETVITLGTMGMQAISSLQLNGLMQLAVSAFLGYLNEERMGDMIRRFLLERVYELQMESHPRREAFMGGLQGQIEKLASDSEVHTRLNDWKNEQAASWKGEEMVLGKLEELRGRLLASMENGAYVQTYILPLCARLIEDLRKDDELLERLNEQIIMAITGWVEKNHNRIGSLVRENVEKMDNAALIALMEDKLGQDLQWIRINGALTGFLIGIVLTGIRMLLE